MYRALRLFAFPFLLTACGAANTESPRISLPIAPEAARAYSEPTSVPPNQHLAREALSLTESVPDLPLNLPIDISHEVIRHPLDEGGSDALPSGLSNPMPGGYLAGYSADTGLDIAGLHRPVFAIASGTLDYAEGGHTLWNGRHDDPYAIRIELDVPLHHGDHLVTHVWYAHLSHMDFELRDGATPRIHIEAGQKLGTSGIANGSPHLHLGMLLDGQVEQEWGTFLKEDGVREVLGSLHNKSWLPKH